MSFSSGIEGGLGGDGNVLRSGGRILALPGVCMEMHFPAWASFSLNMIFEWMTVAALGGYWRWRPRGWGTRGITLGAFMMIRIISNI